MPQSFPRPDRKVAFITGGGTGIGRAAALAFVDEGIRVAIAGRHAEALADVEQEAKARGGEVVSLALDVTQSEQVEAAVERIRSTWGRLDYAFNNAGVEQPPLPLDQINVEEWDRILDTNLRGAYTCMRAEVPLMRASGGGVIVNTSSGAGVMGIKGQAAYCAAKFGLIGMTKAAALDYAGEGIRVNVICPGYVDTPMMGRFTGGSPEGRAAVEDETPLGRVATPEEIADAVVWLCSEKAGFIVGHALVMDGGQTL